MTVYLLMAGGPSEVQSVWSSLKLALEEKKRYLQEYPYARLWIEYVIIDSGDYPKELT